jgi:hypothetical protein
MEFSMLDPETIIILQKLTDVKTQYETRLTELKSQFLRLQGMLEGIDEAIAIVSSYDVKENQLQVPPRSQRGVMKETVLKIIFDEYNGKPCRVENIISIAEESGIKLKKSSVSSLLSRLKNDGILIFDGTGYSAKI